MNLPKPPAPKTVKDKSAPKSAPMTRAERIAKKLRENLKKRKSQMRERTKISSPK